MIVIIEYRVNYYLLKIIELCIFKGILKSLWHWELNPRLYTC